MKQRIKMLLSYDGTDYAGWQIQLGQKNVKTIQGSVEKGLALITRELDIRIVGAGRTDAGVHAWGQVCHFDTASQIPIERLPKALNSVLPRDIRCHQAEKMSKSFSALRSAKEKTYRYTIDHGSIPNVFQRNFAYHVPSSLDILAMKKATGFLEGRMDFQSFCASGSTVKSHVRTIKKIKIKEIDFLIYVDITADGFLYNMARIIVGTLVDIGRGKIPLKALPEIIAAKERTLAGPTAPAKGLCLQQVFY